MSTGSLSPTVSDQRINILLEEWKKNVDLYIDQDKRGFERIKMFLTMNGALLAMMVALWNLERSYLPLEASIAKYIIPVVGLAFALVTRSMSIRSHACIHLRRIQGMLIERALRKTFYEATGVQVDPGSGMPTDSKTLDTKSGVITTFSREHVAFLNEDNEADRKKFDRWQTLHEELKGLDSCGYIYEPFSNKGQWSHSTPHLDWLKTMFFWIYSFWCGLFLLTLIAPYTDYLSAREPVYMSSVDTIGEPDATTPPDVADATSPPAVSNTRKLRVIGGDQQIVDGTGEPPVVGSGQQMVESGGGRQVIETAGGQVQKVGATNDHTSEDTDTLRSSDTDVLSSADTHISDSTMGLGIQTLREEMNSLRSQIDHNLKALERIEATLSELRGKNPVGTTPPAN